MLPHIFESSYIIYKSWRALQSDGVGVGVDAVGAEILSFVSLGSSTCIISNAIREIYIPVRLQLCSTFLAR